MLLMGPTCVGKTGVAIELAKALRTEIISADSMQVYRHMDIGTEKPAPEERKTVRHHMIDVAEPSETYSAGRYIETVAPIIESLLNAGKVPIVAGGTGLYTKAMTRGLFRGPSANPELRKNLLREEEKSPGALYERLKDLDPSAAKMISPGDVRRTLRALEVCLTSGMTMTEAKERLTEPLPYNFLKICLTRDRAELYAMIERRVEAMLKRGLIEEVKGVLGMNPSETAMQAIGYKEIAGFLRGEYALEEAVRLIKRNTKRFAKRQFTWFKKEQNMPWVDITGITDSAQALGKVISGVVGLRDIIKTASVI